MPQAIGAAVAAALFTAGTTAFAVTSAVVAFAVSTAISVGLSLAAAMIFRPGQSQQSVKPSDGQQTIRQPVPPRWKSYGTVRLAGPVWWYATNAANGQFHLGLALNQGRIGGIVSYHIDEATVVIDGSGNVTTSPYSGVTTKILTRLGEPTETAYSEISTAFGVDDVRGDGVASILGIFDNFVDAETQLKNYPNGIPRLRATIDASVAWDPRDPAQSRTDESTWEWSENPVVCLLDYLLMVDGFAIAWSRIEPNLAQWIEAMNICDERVLSIVAGGHENRYRIAGTFLFTDRPADVVARFLSTCDGRCWQKRDGSIGIIVGRFTRPTVSIADRDIISYDLTCGQDPISAVAGIRAQYMSPADDYREQDAEPWPDGETVMELGEDRVAAIDLTWVPSFSQARRLMKRQALREAASWRGTIRTTLAGLRAIDQRFVNLEVTELGVAETFEVGGFSIDMASMEVSLEVLAVGSAIDEWDADAEEGEPAGQAVTTAMLMPLTVDGGVIGHNMLSLRNYLPASVISAYGAQLRVTISSGGNDASVDGVSIVPHSSAANGTTTPTRITFSGANGFVLASGEQITSDWIDFDIDPGIAYLVTIDATQGGVSTGQFASGTLAGAVLYDVNSSPGYALQQNMSPDHTSADEVAMLIRIEVRNGA